MEGSLVAYKVFTNGSVLPASDVNTYLMDQSVMVFSSSATRAAALTAPVEGMLTWLQDTNKYENYNGTAWVALGGSAILQVVSVTKIDAFTTTSTSYTDITGLSASITPSSTSSKILVLSKVSINPRVNSIGDIQLLRGATVIGGGTVVGSRSSGMSSFFTNETLGTGDLSTNFLDSPASVSSQTYKLQVRAQTGTLGINTVATDDNLAVIARTSSTITLMEVAG
jgi:hypothetical protein